MSIEFAKKGGEMIVEMREEGIKKRRKVLGGFVKIEVVLPIFQRLSSKINSYNQICEMELP